RHRRIGSEYKAVVDLHHYSDRHRPDTSNCRADCFWYWRISLSKAVWHTLGVTEGIEVTGQQHELHTYLAQDLGGMASEYKRIRARSKEDPGTAGAEGEEAWAKVLQDWLPDNYQIRRGGRVLGANGVAGPQVDIIVLRPGYPQRLLDKKLYLAGGVAAVFE